MASNLPPGCRVSDIPGNRPEDIEQERQFEFIEKALEPLDLVLDDISHVDSDSYEQACKNVHKLINEAFEAGYQQACADIKYANSIQETPPEC